jgi:hypothetical protein
MMSDPRDLADRYVALWIEPDPDRRCQTIRDLFASDGSHLLQPPRGLSDAAAALGFVPTLRAHGYAALEVRVTHAYEEFVAPGQLTFRLRDEPVRLGDVVKFTWEMVPTGGGDAVGAGLEVLLVDEGGRILVDHQFIVG